MDTNNGIPDAIMTLETHMRNSDRPFTLRFERIARSMTGFDDPRRPGMTAARWIARGLSGCGLLWCTPLEIERRETESL